MQINIRESEDKILLTKISNGDTEAMKDLFNQYSEYLYNIIYYILKCKGESEDTLQEIFILIWDKSAIYKENLGTPISWIVRITRNKSIDKLKGISIKQRKNENDNDIFKHIISELFYEDPESANILKYLRDEIKTPVNNFTEIQKELLEFAYFRGSSLSELAAQFEIPPWTMRTCIRAAILKLRKDLRIQG